MSGGGLGDGLGELSVLIVKTRVIALHGIQCVEPGAAFKQPFVLAREPFATPGQRRAVEAIGGPRSKLQGCGPLLVDLCRRLVCSVRRFRVCLERLLFGSGLLQGGRRGEQVRAGGFGVAEKAIPARPAFGQRAQASVVGEPGLRLRQLSPGRTEGRFRAGLIAPGRSVCIFGVGEGLGRCGMVGGKGDEGRIEFAGSV